MKSLPIQSIISKGRVLELKTVDFIEKPILFPASKATVKETLEVVDFIAGLANTIYAFITFGWIRGLTHSVKTIFLLPNAIGGLSNLPEELSDIDELEKEEILKQVRSKLTFSEDVEAVVVLAIDIAHKLKILVGLFK